MGGYARERPWKTRRFQIYLAPPGAGPEYHHSGLENGSVPPHPLTVLRNVPTCLHLAAPWIGRLTVQGFCGCGKLRGPPLATPTGERGAQTLWGITLQLVGCRGEATGKGLKSRGTKWLACAALAQIGLNLRTAGNWAPLQRTGVAPEIPPK